VRNSGLSKAEQPGPGLRERKKARTRAEIQRHALRLFREQGYEATTVSQIAAAAEVSESTFFRYFPTKEDVVLWDEFDPQLVEVLRAQPAGASPVTALRAAFREVFAELSQAQRAEQHERMALVLSVPPLRATLVDQIRSALWLIAEAVAERTGRRRNDPAVRTLAGAVLGVCLSALFAWAEDPEADIIALVDESIARLEAGLQLA
jgi:AcrR family transcriptional regulator